MDDYTDDDLIRIYEAALGPLHNPTADWLADALVWLRRIVTAETEDEAVAAASVWTGEPAWAMVDFTTAIRAAAGRPAPAPEPEPEATDPRIVHIDTVKTHRTERGRRFASRAQHLSTAAGGVRLGCSRYEVAPGKRAFPFHAHHGTEEAIYILQGQGLLRLGDGEYPVGAGTYAAFPPGPDAPHQLINTGTVPLRYLCISARTSPDVVVYPDSGKVMSTADGWPPRVRTIARESLDYWDGEDVG